MDATFAVKILNERNQNDVDQIKGNDTNDTGSNLIKELKINLTSLKSNFMDEETGKVNYVKMLDSEDFAAYRRLTYKLGTLQKWMKDSSVPSEERKAFFINLYNCLMIDALVECSLHSDNDGQERKLPVSPLKASHEGGGNIWKSSAYNVGGFILTLDDIEHGILRGNRPHPSSSNKQHFLPDDNRSMLAVELDPRIHFALNCGATSCPPIRVYSSANLDSQLDRAAASFLCADGAIILSDPDKTVQISKLLLWYGCDFGKNDSEVLSTISSLIQKSNSELAALVEKGSTNGYKIIYHDYDWNLNISK